ncbi:hypothetical protein CR513_22579, partial [Mucuna pruriens]
MWKNKGRSKRKNYYKKFTKETKDKSQMVCYECKKPRHFKSECSSLEKEKEKKKKNTFFKKKKGLMEIMDDLDLSSSEEEDEEANICLVEKKTTNHLQTSYQELLSNSSSLSIGYKDLKKNFSKLSKEFDALHKETDLLKKENGSLKEEKDKNLSSVNTLEVNKKLQEEVIDLRQSLAKFVNGSKNLRKILKHEIHL